MNKNDILRENQSYPDGAESEKWKTLKRKYIVCWIFSVL
jgi:hypothetical protein